MPNYNYKCTECESVTELFHSIDDFPVSVQFCDCGGMLRKQFAPLGIIFKGSGFYANDNKKKT